jgi:mediator of RNA polymerase II transcription subunit 6
MTGVEYALVEAQEPNIYIIRKQQRESPTVCVPLKTYYCLNSVVYQVCEVLSMRNQLSLL